MSLRAFFPDVLSDLEFAQAVNDERPDDQTGEQRGQTRKRSTEREISENAEWREVVIQLDEQQPVKQSASTNSVVRCQLRTSDRDTSRRRSFENWNRSRYQLQATSHSPPAINYPQVPSTSPEPSPVSRRVTLSAEPHRRLWPRAQAIPRPLPVSRRTPRAGQQLSPPPPSVGPTPALRPERQSLRSQYAARMRDASAPRWGLTRASRPRQRSGASLASPPAHPPSPRELLDSNCSNRSPL